MNKIIALNHKMNLNYNELKEYIEKINSINTPNDIMIFPTYLYLESFIKECKYKIGSQNVSNEPYGSFTGEVSSHQLNSLGVQYCIVGHSERRTIYNETDELIKEKTRMCIANNIIPVICVGETLSEKQNDETMVKINNQISHAILGLDDIENKSIIIAYEPVYAIGTGMTPTIEEISEVINYIYNIISKYDKITCSILYGGSVNQKNIKQILSIDKLDGVLIGTISSKINEIKKIIEIAS